MSSTWICWSGHESTCIYYVLESQRLEFPFQASKTKKKASVTRWVQKTVKVSGPYLQLCKNTGTSWSHAHWYKENQQCLDVACSVLPWLADVQQAARPRGEHGQEQLTKPLAPRQNLNYECTPLKFKGPRIVKKIKRASEQVLFHTRWYLRRVLFAQAEQEKTQKTTSWFNYMRGFNMALASVSCRQEKKKRGKKGAANLHKRQFLFSCQPRWRRAGEMLTTPLLHSLCQPALFQREVCCFSQEEKTRVSVLPHRSPKNTLWYLLINTTEYK